MANPNIKLYNLTYYGSVVLIVGSVEGEGSFSSMDNHLGLYGFKIPIGTGIGVGQESNCVLSEYVH